MDLLIVKPYYMNSKNGKFSARFDIGEHFGDVVRITQFKINDCEYNSKEEALKIAENKAIIWIKNNYPADVKIRIDK